MLAGNEQFRRFTYKSKMYIKGEAGGFCCPPNVGNAGLSCPCNPSKRDWLPFPILQIKTAAHEMAHWYIKRVFQKMHAAGYLTLPEFKNTPEWSFKAYDGSCTDGKIVEKDPTYLYLWNAVNQAVLRGVSKIDTCKTHHYFIYSGQDKYLSFVSNGKKKEEARRKLEEKDPNLFNLLKLIWPCNNRYISVCEDSAHGMTKGLAQKLLLGKSDPKNPTNMICNDDDTAEIGETDVAEVTPLPKANVFTEDQTDAKQAQKCVRVMNLEGWMQGYADLLDLPIGKVQESLADSNERGWWLRKCCARTAKFFEHTDDQARREQYEAKREVAEQANDDLAAKQAAVTEREDAVQAAEEARPIAFAAYDEARSIRMELKEEKKIAENAVNQATKEANFKDKKVQQARNQVDAAAANAQSARAKAEDARQNANKKAESAAAAQKAVETANRPARAQAKADQLSEAARNLALKADNLEEAAAAADEASQDAADALQEALQEQTAKNEDVKNKSEILDIKTANLKKAIQVEDEKKQALEDAKQAIEDAASALKLAGSEVKTAEKALKIANSEAANSRKEAAKFY